jgi:hypothetical protein
MFKIINYPQTVEDSHALIDLLVGLLNDRGGSPVVQSITPAADNKFHTHFSEIPHGLNGGVSFGEDRGHRPTPANESEVRGSHGYIQCPF